MLPGPGEGDAIRIFVQHLMSFAPKRVTALCADGMVVLTVRELDGGTVVADVVTGGGSPTTKGRFPVWRLACPL